MDKRSQVTSRDFVLFGIGYSRPQFMNSYWTKSLWRVDWALTKRYPLKKAYQISLRERPKNQHAENGSFTYGETPISTFTKLLQLAGVQPGETMVELGCGTGRLSLMTALLYDIEVVGIEQLTTFVTGAKQIAKRLRIRNCTFSEAARPSAVVY